MKDFTPVAKQIVAEVKNGWTYVQVASSLECLRNEVQRDMMRGIREACEARYAMARSKCQSGLDEEQVGRATSYADILGLIEGMDELLEIQRKCLTSGITKPLKDRGCDSK